MPVSGISFPEQQEPCAAQSCGSCSQPVLNEFPLESRQNDRGFSRDRTISRSTEFREAFDAGINRVGKLMVIWPRTADNTDSRLGVIASKRTFAKAVNRNRAKRMIREAFRLNRYKLRTDCDFVIVARRKILKATLEDVARDLVRLVGENK